MASVKPFKAIRPAKDKFAFVASKSYQEYSKKELEAELAFNPFSFLHIINPGFKYDKRVSGDERFQLVHSSYLKFLEDNILMKDALDSFYLYQIEKGDFKCCGLFCATSVEDYQNDVIKKHEATLLPREELFASYLKTVSFNAEPVLMTYAENDKIASIVTSQKSREPDYFFTTKDKVKHRLWIISNTNIIGALVQEFSKINALYIADGHHRSASSNRFAERCKESNSEHNGQEPYNSFMSYLIPETEIRIFEFNRMVKDLNGLSIAEFLIALKDHYSIEKQDIETYRPTKKHEFSMYLDGSFYSLQLRKKYLFSDALSQLDTQILFKTILEPILGIVDLRNDKRIHYGYGKQNIIEMKEAIDTGKFAVGFSMVPITIDEIKAIADAGQVMPPKSTYIEPKLRSGIAIYEL